MAKYIDIGVNLTNKQLSDQIETILQDSKDNGVEAIIITGASVRGSYEALNLAKHYKQYKLYSTAGIHPNHASSGNDSTIKNLTKLLENKLVVAIGECGLDYKRLFSAKETQIKWFKEQLNLAVKFNKPVFLHEREAFDDFYNILYEYKGKIKGVVHCFTGTMEQAKKYVDLGMYIGITTWICDDRRNQNLIEALKYIPLEKMMVETDSPFLSPNPRDINVPSNIKYAVERIAKELNKDSNELAQIFYNNTKAFFAII